MKKLYILAIAALLSIGGLRSQQTIGLFTNDSTAFNGYSLFTVSTGTYLIDNCGYLVNNWTHLNNPGLSCYLTDSGHLLRTGNINGDFVGGGAGGLIEEYDWDGNLLWSYQHANAEHHHHHDIEEMPNGNILLIAWEFRSEAEVLQAGAVFEDTYSPTQIIEIEKVGATGANIVWEWHIWDHLIQDEDATKDNFGVVADHPELIDVNAYFPQGGFTTGDWIHCNGIDYNADRDEIILSAHDFHEVWVLDHSTTSEEAASHTGGAQGRGGDILYRWGNPQAYGRGDEESQILWGQHDAKWIPEGYPMAGMISVFNNGKGQPGPDYSSLLVFDPAVDAMGQYIDPQDEAYGPAEVSWLYEADPPESFYSPNQGGVQIQPNGNFLYSSTTQGRLLEITAEGDTAWYYKMTISAGNAIEQGQNWSPQGGTAFRVEKYAVDFPGFEGRDLTPISLIELNPLPSDCEIFNGAVPVAEYTELEGVRVMMNNQNLIINNELGQSLEIQLLDLSGRLLFEDETGQTIYSQNLSALPNGIFICALRSKDGQSGNSFKISNF